MYLHMELQFVILVKQQATVGIEGECSDLADGKLYRHLQSGGRGQREEDPGVRVGGLVEVCKDKFDP